MQAPSGEHRRLLMELSTLMKDINQEIINPEIPELTMDDLHPVLKTVAYARKNYLKTLFDIAQSDEYDSDGVDIEKIKMLRLKRATYEELLEASKAMELAIERGYLDVK